MSDFIQDIFGGLVPDLLEAVVTGITSVISALLDFFYNLIFVELKPVSLSFGNKIVNFFGDSFFNQSFTMYSIAYAVGFVFIVFIVNKSISIIRG